MLIFRNIFFQKSEREFPTIPKCGYTKQGETVVTKHDITMAGRRNACRVMEFPPEFHTGDGGGFDMQLSNKVSQKRICLRGKRWGK